MRKAYTYSHSTKHNIEDFQDKYWHSAMEVQGKTSLLAGNLGKSVTSNDIFIQTSAVVGDQRGCVFMWTYIN